MSINTLNTDNKVATLVVNPELLAQNHATANAGRMSTPALAEEEATLSRADAEKSVDGLNDLLSTATRDLTFSIDDSTGTTVLRVTNVESGDLIRQIPNEEALHLMKRARDALDQSIAFLLDEKV